MFEQKLKELGREDLQKIVTEMSEYLTKEQRKKLNLLIEKYREKGSEPGKPSAQERMSQKFVDEKMAEIKKWMRQIDEGELSLDVEEYEDYSAGYWDSDWITEYYDEQGIGDRIVSAIRFAKDCVDDRRYEEANFIYEWLWNMSVSTESEYEDEPVDLEMLVEKEIVSTDMKQLALLTLYADYQVLPADERAQDIYLYFSMYPFRELHIEDMFRMGKENLKETERFWEDWIALLQTKKGNVEGRLLKEAVLQYEGVEGLVKTADKNCAIHPSLYLAAMEEYEKKQDYERMEQIGERALEKVEVKLSVRGEIALRAAYASSCLRKTENMMRFCFEGFRSDTTERNFLRLFGMKEMAQKYGVRGTEVLRDADRGRAGEYASEYANNTGLQRNLVTENTYYSLQFYTGDFASVKQASKNPKGSLGWSTRFIHCGIRLFLLYLYEYPELSAAAAGTAAEVGFFEDTDSEYRMDFEKEIAKESAGHGAGVFWSYFKRWKEYFPMGQEEKEKYLAWAEKIVHDRADALVKGQHRGHYAEAAELLAMVAEVKESMGSQGAKQKIFAEYKNKFPRHSSFQKEMKRTFHLR